MISDEERRRFAARLRDIDTVSTPDGWLAFREEVCEELGIAADGEYCEPAAINHLADLIDIPTTVLDPTETTRTVHGEEVHGWECRECGQSCEEMYGSYEYCPHCGRKVVEP